MQVGAPCKAKGSVQASAMANPNRPVLDLMARCACGAVSVVLKGPIYSMLICACEDCQKATGTGHSTIAIANPADVIVTGETRGFERIAASGATFTRHFCPACGTPIYGRSSRSERSIMLPVGLFAGQNDWFAPTQMIFARTMRGWDVIADHLPRHNTYREQAHE